MPVSSFIMSNVSEYQVQCLFNALNKNKASISLPNTLIRTASSIQLPLFTMIYNESINTGTVPDILKISRATPSERATNPNNYRPISTLSPFAKVLERLVYDQLELFLTKKKVIYEYQFGFR